ncbi:hypothetical protein D3C77_469700 [compost metagenome]
MQLLLHLLNRVAGNDLIHPQWIFPQDVAISAAAQFVDRFNDRANQIKNKASGQSQRHYRLIKVTFGDFVYVSRSLLNIASLNKINELLLHLQWIIVTGLSTIYRIRANIIKSNNPLLTKHHLVLHRVNRFLICLSNARPSGLIAADRNRKLHLILP